MEENPGKTKNKSKEPKEKTIIKFLETDQELEKIKKLGLHVVPLELNEERFEKSNTWETAVGYSPEEIKLYKKYRERYSGGGADGSGGNNFKKVSEFYKKTVVDEEYYFDIGEVVTVEGFRYLRLPTDTTFYKGVKYFYSKMINADYFWCATKKTAMEFARDYEGSILIYKVENPLDLLILDEENLKILYKQVSAKEKEIISGVFGINLTFEEYKRIMCIKKPSWCDELWFYNEHTITRDNPMKTRYPTHLNSGWDLHDLLYSKFPNLKGTIIPYHISCFNRDQFEEVNLKRDKNKITMIKDDDLYWENWGLELPSEDKFLLNEDYPRNYNFKVFNWYNDATHNNILNGFDKIDMPNLKDQYRILSYNVRKLTSANALIKPEQLIVALKSLIKQANPNIVVLQEFPIQSIGSLKGFFPEMIYTKNGSGGAQLVVLSKTRLEGVTICEGRNKRRNSILFNYAGVKIAAICIESGASYDGLRFFCTISEFVHKYSENLKTKTTQIKEILERSPDLIIGDFSFDPTDIEMKLLEKYESSSSTSSTTIHGCKMDFAVWNKKIKGTEHVLEYYESDHKPIIFDFNILASGGVGDTGQVGNLNNMVLFGLIVFLILCIVYLIYRLFIGCPIAVTDQSLIDR